MTQLKRQLGFWDAVAINVGIIIGVGIFRVPSEVAKHIASPTTTIWLWVIGGAISLLGVMCYAELSSRFPHTGGTYVFLREAYGKLTGFLYGWSEVTVLRAASIAAVAYVFADYFLSLFPIGQQYAKWVALIAILFLTGVNIMGVHTGTWVQKIVTLAKVTVMMGMAAVIFLIGRGSAPETSQVVVMPLNGWQQWTAAGSALIPILFTYGGWQESSFMSGEFRDTKRELPWAIIMSVVLVSTVYLIMNVSYLKAFSPDEMIHHPAVASDILERVVGKYGKMLAAGAVLVSSFGALSANILTGGRIPFAIAQDTPRFSWFGSVHPKYGTPLRSLIFNGVWAAVLVLWGNFEQLLFFSGFSLRIFFILIGLSIFKIRKKKQTHDGFAMIGYPLVPILFTASSVWMCWASFEYAPKESLTGVLLILAGIPAYYLAQGRGRAGTIDPR